VDEVKQLLKNTYVDPDPNNDGWTPLIVAAREGHKDVVELLLTNGANIDQQSGSGWTALMSAGK
jgi:ankyrin repeat protein